MGLIQSMWGVLFGDGRNVVKDTIEVLRPNAEASAQRGDALDAKTLEQLAAEFQRPSRGMFDAFVDGLNRLPRPMFVLGIFLLLVWTAVDPITMANVFTTWSLIPEPVWVIVGVIVSAYFGGRHQVKQLDFAKALAETAARTPQVIARLGQLEALRHDTPGIAEADPAELEIDAENRALAEWRSASGKMGPSAGAPVGG